MAEAAFTGLAEQKMYPHEQKDIVLRDATAWLRLSQHYSLHTSNAP